MKILIWNTEWAKPKSKREQIIKKIVKTFSPDIICITEGYLETWDEFGHVISSTEDYGYRITEGRRKAILVSKEPWDDVDNVGNSNIPSGRFITGTTQGIDVVGVCIPWKDAHVNTGRKDKQAWEDHMEYLIGLQAVLEKKKKNNEVFVMGDFNQRVPRKYSRQDVYNLMIETFKDFTVETQNNIQPIDKLSIDHFASKNSTECTLIESIDNIQDGLKLSDHFGLKLIL